MTARIWGTMWDRHVAACHSQSADPASGVEISRLLDELPLELKRKGIQCDDTEMTAAFAYFEAAAGQRVRHRPHLVVWWDANFRKAGRCGPIQGCWRFGPPPWPDDFTDPPPLERMLRTTAAEDVRRDVPVALMTP